jgi:hypothetical protein
LGNSIESYTDYIRKLGLAMQENKVMMAWKDESPELVKWYLQDLMQMKQEELELDSVWRVKVYPDGLVELNDFTMPSKTGKLVDKISQTDVPDWIRDALAVLQIVDDGAVVDGVGRKINEQIYYITERK